jgi:hypothetical protein
MPNRNTRTSYTNCTEKNRPGCHTDATEVAIANKIKFTPGTIAALPPTEKTIEYFGKDIGGFGLRQSSKGKITFFLLARYPSPPNPTRRAVGVFYKITDHRNIKLQLCHIQ